MPPVQAFRLRSFNFACRIVRFYRELERTPRVPPQIARQLLRSGVSIGANLEEGRAAQSRRDLVSKFSLALKESRETHYWLRLMIATELAPASLVSPLLDEAEQLVAILTTSVRRLKRDPAG